MTTLNEQLRIDPQCFIRDDMEKIEIVSASVDGTERHAVRRVTWKATGNTSGNRTECGRTPRPGSFSNELPVTCKKCIRLI